MGHEDGHHHTLSVGGETSHLLTSQMTMHWFLRSTRSSHWRVLNLSHLTKPPWRIQAKQVRPYISLLLTVVLYITDLLVLQGEHDRCWYWNTYDEKYHLLNLISYTGNIVNLYCIMLLRREKHNMFVAIFHQMFLYYLLIRAKESTQICHKCVKSFFWSWPLFWLFHYNCSKHWFVDNNYR